MKNYSLKLFTSVLLLISANCFAQDKHAFIDELKYTDSEVEIDDSLTRTGEISATELIAKYPKFKTNFDNYNPSAEDIKNFKKLKNFELLVFFGLWCHDSQREIPHLLKLIELSKTRFKKVKLIALNPKKVLSEEYSHKYKISNTPTIFVIKNHRVLAELVERPQESITKDLLKQIFH